jgi:hypothetical protein
MTGDVNIDKPELNAAGDVNIDNPELNTAIISRI